MKYDLCIIGGGPAAAAAGVYAARKKLNTLVVAKEFGGQSIVSAEIYNWIGSKAISGAQLAKDLKEHLYSYEGELMTVVEGEAVTDVSGTAPTYTVTTDKGATYEAAAVLVAAGANRRKLPVSGAEQLEHKGLTYCASCDGPLFSGMDVAVVGGGNAGFESAAQLLAYTKSVTLLEYLPDYKADAVTVEKVLAHENMTGLNNVEVTEVVGDKMVSGLKYKDRESGEEKELAVTGVFVEIGVVPSTDFVKDLVELDDMGHIKVDARTQRASTTGIWAAGDCTDGLYAQNNIAVGDAIKALEDIYVYLKAS